MLSQSNSKVLSTLTGGLKSSQFCYTVNLADVNSLCVCFVKIISPHPRRRPTAVSCLQLLTSMLLFLSWHSQSLPSAYPSLPKQIDHLGEITCYMPFKCMKSLKTTSLRSNLGNNLLFISGLAVTVGHRTNSGQSCYVSGQILCYLSGHA